LLYSKTRSLVSSNVIALSESLASGCVRLEELLVEESWLEALPGEFQKDYAVNLSKFVETEICKDDYVYPPQHLIFNALNTTPFQSVKVVILGQVRGFRFGLTYLNLSTCISFCETD